MMLYPRIITLLFFVLVTNLCLAQTELVWGTPLVSDKGIVSHQLSDGSIWMIGASSLGTIGGVDIVAVKFDSLGNYLSPIYSYGSSDHDYPNSMIYQDGKFIIAGEHHSLNGIDGFILIIDSLGNSISFQTYGQNNQSEQFYDIEATQDGGFVVTGFGATTSSIGNDFLISKFDSLGQQEWIHIHELGQNETGVSILEKPNGGYLLAGDQLQAWGGYNVVILACDSSGLVLWDSIISSPYNGGCKSMIAVDNQLIIVGEMATVSSTAFDIYMARIDWQGNTLWQGTIPKTDNGDAAFNIFAKSNNEFILTGYSYVDTSTGTDLMVMAVDSTGNIIHEKYYGGPEFDMGYDIKPSLNGGYIITGFSNQPDNQFYLIIDNFSTFSSVHNLNNNDSSPLYPNPASNWIQLPKEFTNYNIELIDITGRSYPIKNNSLQLDIRHLTAGFYWIICTNKTGQIVLKNQFLKN